LDIKEYIESGIIEAFVLGSCNQQQQREVTCLSAIYPEILTELEKTQMIFEQYAHSIAFAAPEVIKNNIELSIKNTPQDVSLEIIHEDSEISKWTSKIPVIMKLVMAASIAMLLGIGLLYLSNRNSMNKLEVQAASFANEKFQFTKKIEAVRAALDEKNSLNLFVLHTNTDELVLTGTNISPHSKVRVYWNNKVSKVVLVTDYLPAPADGKQYQLWAISDGKPFDLGMLDRKNSNSNSLKQTPKSVQAFAITLEKVGGNILPTMDQMYVVGVINSIIYR
jgi:phosphatidate phosphatase PAH1